MGSFYIIEQIQFRGKILDRKRLGGCPQRLLENQMKKHFKWVMFAGVVLILLMAAPTIPQLVVLLAIPWKCDEGTSNGVNNALGDIVAVHARACTGVGTIVDYSVVLQAHGAATATTLVEFNEPYSGYPKFRWINDDSLSVDLGKLSWVSLKTDRVGPDPCHLSL
jgi:hypothetical protein